VLDQLLADKRADVWAFAVILYELFTGKRLFNGEDFSETLARVLRDEPNFDAIPVEIRPLLRRCLEKDPMKRQRDIADAKNELEDALSTRSTALRVAAAPPAQRTLRVHNVAIAVLLLIVGALAGIGIWRDRFQYSNADSSGVVRMSITIPSSIRVAPAGFPPRRQILFTRDGSGLIMLGNPRKPDGEYDTRARIYTRRLGEYEFKPIPKTEASRSGRPLDSVPGRDNARSVSRNCRTDSPACIRQSRITRAQADANCDDYRLCPQISGGRPGWTR